MSAVKCALSIFCGLFLLAGLYDLLHNRYKNDCEMTYMFQLPQYIKVPMTFNLQGRFPHYKIFVYGEGTYAESLKRQKFKGIPVIFIPGNVGSYKQVRSLASVAYSIANDERHPFHFNFFALDLNEERSAFLGPALTKQMEFTSLAIKTILKFYPKKNDAPQTVILVGHSMGGIIAQRTALEKDLHISLIITQAAPLARPVIETDQDLYVTYNEVQQGWERERNNSLKNVVLVSVGAGRNDIQVPSALTSSPHADLEATTMSVPGCWLTTDHLAVVWCRQLVLSTVRALFHAVDKKTHRLSADRNVVVDSFKFHLSQRPGSKHAFPPVFPNKISDFPSGAQWQKITTRQVQFELNKAHSDHFLMIPMFHEYRVFKHLSLVAKEIGWKNWVFACNPDLVQNGTKICSEGVNLSGFAHIEAGDRRQLELDVGPYVKRGLSHLVVWTQPNNDEVTIDVDITDVTSRKTEFTVPPLYEFFSSSLVLPATPINSVTYNLSLQGLTEPWQSYTLRLDSLHKCKDNRQLPIVKMRPSWTKRWDYVPARSPRSEFVLELDVNLAQKTVNSTVDVHIILNPSCTYNISMEANPIGTARRFLVTYGTQIPAYISAQIFLVIAIQMRAINKDGNCPCACTVLATLSPLVIVPAVKTISFIPKTEAFTDEFEVMEKMGLSLPILPIFLFMVSLGITFVVFFMAYCFVSAISSGIPSIPLQLASLFHIPEFVMDKVYAVAGSSILSMSLLFASFAVFSHAEVLMLCFAWLVIKTGIDYNECSNEIFARLIGQSHNEILCWSTFHYSMSILVLVWSMAIKNLPSFTLKNRHLSGIEFDVTALSTIEVAVAFVLTFITMYQKVGDNIVPGKRIPTVISIGIYMAACYSIAYSSMHLHRLSYAYISVGVWIILNHFLRELKPPVLPPVEDEDEEDHETEEDSEAEYDYNHNNEYSGEELTEDEDLGDTEELTSDEDNDHVVEPDS